MLRILTILMTVAVLTLFGAPVLKTGQTTVYTKYDDGHYQAGAVRSYSRSGDVVRDNVTGLEWQDNETVSRSWAYAATYCNDLTLDNGGGWRLPSIEELETLVDDGHPILSITEGVFQHIIGSYYWSSTTYAADSDYAWFVAFSNGNIAKAAKVDHISQYKFYVRCVRGEPLEPLSLNRDDEAEIVSDTAIGLQWQDDAIVVSAKHSWIEAIDYCENNLTLGGHDDWRLPNRKELLSIADRSQYNPAIDDTIFVNISSHNWSSTTYANGKTRAWIVSFYHGASDNYDKSFSSYVRCVRGGEFDDSAPPLPAIIMYLLN